MSWLNVNLNESLSNIKGQLTNLASNVLTDASEDDSGLGKERVDALEKLVTNQESEIKRLQRENGIILQRIASNNAAADWTWETSESNKLNCDDEEVTIIDWQGKVVELQQEKEELIQSLEQLDQDCQRTTDKLIAIKDDLQTENADLKLQQLDIRKENSYLKINADEERKKMQRLEEEKKSKDVEVEKLRNEFAEYKRNHRIDEMRKALGENEESTAGIVRIEEYNKLQSVISDFNKQIEIYERELNQLRRDSRLEDDSRLSGDSSMSPACFNRKYFDLLLEAMLKTDSNSEKWTIQRSSECGELVQDAFSEYNNLIENIVKTISDNKWRCESLKEEMKNLQSEKKLLLTEKNHEIEKLIANAQEMTKALTLKNQEIAHYEEECAHINRNNEILISKLEEAKHTNMALHTIPEMNEHLDGQLEKCYKRIEHLEREADLRVNEQVDELKCMLALSEKELHLANISLDEWKAKCNTLEDESGSLAEYVESIKKRFKECYSEKEELEDRVKVDSENIAAQTLNLETLQEEVEILTATIVDLRRDNFKYSQDKEEVERKLEEAAKEINDLKEEMTTEIETSLKKDEQMTEFNSTVDCMESNIRKLKGHVETLSQENEELILCRSNYISNYRHFKMDVEKLITCYREIKEANGRESSNIQEVIREKNELVERMLQMEEVSMERGKKEECELSDLQSKIASLESDNLRLTNDNSKLDVEIGEVTLSRNNVIQLVQQKHQESLTYHGEIQRLQQLLSIETEKCKTFETQLAELHETETTPDELQAKESEFEKLHEQNVFLREKCALLAESLLQEQSNTQRVLAEKSVTSEREANLQRQLESLREHLLQVEEAYTKEIQTAEAKSVEMQQKLQAVVEKEKNSSNRFTSANIRANQQVETLQTNLQLVTNQRDELKRKVADLEDQMEKQNAALCNLQIVLEQFQRDKEKVIFEETERVRRKVVLEKRVQEALKEQINELKLQLEESKVGLKAAVRLTDQVETSKRLVASMKEEVTKLQSQLNKSEEKYDKLLNQTDGRVDKMLVKNLVIGLVTCNKNLSKDQNQILRIISTVLDFNQQDIEKVNLHKKDQSTWFSSIAPPETVVGETMTSQSLTQAFVKFLEAESKPRSFPNLLDATAAAAATATTTTITNSAAATTKSGESSESGNSSRKTSVRQSPLLLNEVVLPTFADFAANRNSSSILKDVLKDNTNVS